MSDGESIEALRARLADAETRVREAEQKTLALDSLASHLARVHDPASVAAVVTDFVHETLGGGTVVLALAGRPTPGKLSLFDARHVEEDVRQQFQTFAEDAPVLCAVAHRERRAIFFENVDQLRNEASELAETIERYERHAGAALPLLSGDRSLGAIAFSLPAARPIPEAERDVMAAIARQAAVSLERAELLERSQREAARVRYLAHAGAQLASTTETRETFAMLAKLAVPELADWAAVDLFLDQDTVDRVAVAHVDPQKVALVETLVKKYPPRLHRPDDGLGQILRTGQPQLVPEIPQELLVQGARDEEHLRVLQELGLRSYVCVPIASRGKVRGAFTLIAAESGRSYGQDDLELAQEIARRASIALDVADVLEEVRRAEQIAKRADRHKDEFLAMLGHELRNPLAAISAAAEVMGMRADVDEASIERAHAAMRRQVDHMKRMLDDLLDVARIARGKLSIDRRPVDLAAVVRHTVEDHRADVERGGLTMTVELPPSETMVLGDATRLAQIVANLMLNATKFTPSGGRIDVRLETRDERAVLEVTDTGIGFDPSEVAVLFDPFVQAQRTHERSRGGLGLGLALVKGLAELHGGSVGAHSEGAGRGATFCVMLPTADAVREAATEEAHGTGTPLRILIVEDDVDGGDMLAMLVERLGHEVHVAPTGKDGIARARQLRPDLVLCDIGLPGGMDGYDVARALREASDVGEPLIVALTGFGLPEHVARAERAGFDRYFTKPISAASLREVFELARARSTGRR